MSDSLRTKKSIAAALKSLIPSKPFAKISISDITEICGLNRQTFYYHFQDKYELLTWIYHTEGFAYALEGITFENWDQKILTLLNIMKKDQNFYSYTIKNDSHYFIDHLLSITSALFAEAIETLDYDHKLRSDQKDFISQFYAHGICGAILSWVNCGMKIPPEEMAKNFRELATHTENLAFKFYTF